MKRLLNDSANLLHRPVESTGLSGRLWAIGLFAREGLLNGNTT